MSTTETLLPGIGIYRISRDAGRAAAGKLHSDENQIAIIEQNAERRGVRIVDWLDETDVPGDTPLHRRPYGKAIERVESGEVSVIMFAHSDRHDRDMMISREAIERVDATPNGILIAGDSTLTHKTVEGWAQATFGSFMSEMQKRIIKSKSHDGVATAIAKGRLPYRTVPIGLRLNADQTARVVDDERELQLVRDAFQMRADGAPYEAVRQHLAANGYVRTLRPIQKMLQSKLYIGELHHGAHKNLRPGFDAIIDVELFERVQLVRPAPTGRTAKSDRLLARQDVLHCTCGARMVVQSGETPSYRCGNRVDCDAPATIRAVELEAFVSDATRAHLIDATARESVLADAVQARDDAITAERLYKRARKLLVLDDSVEDDEAQEQLDELRADAESKLATADELELSCERVKSVNAARDWDLLSLAAQRLLIRDAVADVVVRRGHGGEIADRVTLTLKLKSKQPSSLTA